MDFNVYLVEDEDEGKGGRQQSRAEHPRPCLA